MTTRYDQFDHTHPVDDRLDDLSTVDPELDALLVEWHERHRTLAAARRETLLAQIASVPSRGSTHAPSTSSSSWMIETSRRSRGVPFASLRIAACVALAAILALLFMPRGVQTASADAFVNIPDGGRLEAFDRQGNVIGPCILTHTHVDAEISGPFARVSVRQQYHNPYEQKVETVYTFPLSHSAAVDSMRMIIDGDRVVEGEIKERIEARQIYEAARAANHVAALLEQERPNIFTQSIANIEPGASIEIEISYIEMIQPRDGVYSFAFPMTVSPRYVPGYSGVGDFQRGRGRARLPEGLTPREGVILRGPATFERTKIHVDYDEHGNPIPQFGVIATHSLGPAPALQRIIDAAIPVTDEGLWEWRWRPENQERFHRLSDVAFFVHYPGEEGAELGQLSGDGMGHIAGRWFWFDPAILTELGWIDGGEHAAREPVDGGAGHPRAFASDTDQVPDASRITPMPVRPPTRAGHDISLTVRIDTGGPAITWYKSELHDVADDAAPDAAPEAPAEGADPSRLTLALKNDRDIPNRDFVLNWRVQDDLIRESTFVHAGEDFNERGGHFTLILAPPARITPTDIPPRELIFVLDTSGSMSGFPMAKAQSVLSRALDAMRPEDTFNVITFSGHTRILWDEPRPNTDINRAEALAMVNSRTGSGGTEMMKAIEAALKPGGGRENENRREAERQKRGEGDAVNDPPLSSSPPLRICVFLTDGLVGNDHAIIDAVKKYAGTTRVFSFGVGNSVNRYLLANMAHAGRGEVEFVTQESDRTDAVERFTRRIESPVLTDIELEFSDDLEVADLMPTTPAGLIPDVFDQRPIILHGRYSKSGRGTLTIRGNTAHGRYERAITLDFPARSREHRVIRTLWARAMVDQLTNADLRGLQLHTMGPDDRNRIVDFAIDYGIMSPFTSFVAVEKARVTIDGKPMLVPIPIELPDDARWEGFFGERGDVCDEMIETLLNRVRLTSHLEVFARIDPAAAEAIEHFERGTREAQALLDTAQFTRARQYALIAAVGLDRMKDRLPEQYVASGQSRAAELLSKIAQADERYTARSTSSTDLESSRSSMSRKELTQQREGVIASNLVRVRELQLSGRYDDALQVVDQILFLDEDNPAALALRDAIQTSSLWQQFVEGDRAREFTYSWQFQNNREAGISPTSERLFWEDLGRSFYTDHPSRLNPVEVLYFTGAAGGEGAQGADVYGGTIVLSHADADRSAERIQSQYRFENTRTLLDPPSIPGPRSTIDLMTYPQDWPQLGVMRSEGEANQSVSLHGDIPALGDDLGGRQESVIRTQLQLLFDEVPDRAAGATTLIVLPADVVPFHLLTSSDSSEAHGTHYPTTTPQLSSGEADALALADPVAVLIERIRAIETLIQKMLASQPSETPEADDGPADRTSHDVQVRDQTSHDAERLATLEAAAGRFAIAALVDPTDPANASFHRERVIMVIRLLVHSGHIHEARLVVGWLSAMYVDDSDIAQLKTLLAFDPADAASLDALKSDVNAIADRAKERVSQVIAHLAVEQRLVRILSEELLHMLAASQTESDSPADGALEGAMVTISILVSSLDDEATGDLREHGLEIISTAHGAMLHIGRARLADLPDLALRPTVRRVERALLESN